MIEEASNCDRSKSGGWRRARRRCRGSLVGGSGVDVNHLFCKSTLQAPTKAPQRGRRRHWWRRRAGGKDRDTAQLRDGGHRILRQGQRGRVLEQGRRGIGLPRHGILGRGTLCGLEAAMLKLRDGPPLVLGLSGDSAWYSLKRWDGPPRVLGLNPNSSRSRPVGRLHLAGGPEQIEVVPPGAAALSFSSRAPKQANKRTTAIVSFLEYLPHLSQFLASNLCLDSSAIVQGSYSLSVSTKYNGLLDVTLSGCKGGSLTVSSSGLEGTLSGCRGTASTMFTAAGLAMPAALAPPLETLPLLLLSTSGGPTLLPDRSFIPFHLFGKSLLPDRSFIPIFSFFHLDLFYCPPILGLWPGGSAADDDAEPRQQTGPVSAKRASWPGQRPPRSMHFLSRRRWAGAAREDERKVRDPSGRPRKINRERGGPSALAGNGFRAQENNASVTVNVTGHNWSTALSRHTMRGGRHFAEFSTTPRNELDRYFAHLGVIRPVSLSDGIDLVDDWEGIVHPVTVSDNGYGYLRPTLSGKLRSQRTARWGESIVHCCTYDCFDGRCYWTDWGNGRDSFHWQGREGLPGRGTIGLLLDLDEGTLSVFKNGRLLGVMKEGLGGEYCWLMADSPHSKHANGLVGISSAAIV
ncbi:hypothetical protein THAOC_04133, partial [Thalassiosira oceanica]